MKIKMYSISYTLFLGISLVSALRYIYLGQWKDYVMLFGLTELLVVSIGVILFAIKRTRLNSQKFILILLGVMQLFPMVGAFGLRGGYTAYGIFHVLIIAWCVAMIFVSGKKELA